MLCRMWSSTGRYSISCCPTSVVSSPANASRKRRARTFFASLRWSMVPSGSSFGSARLRPASISWLIVSTSQRFSTVANSRTVMVRSSPGGRVSFDISFLDFRFQIFGSCPIVHHSPFIIHGTMRR